MVQQLFYLYFVFKCTCEFLMRSYPVQFRGWENLGQRLKWVYSSENSYLLMEHTRTLEAKRILFSIKMDAWIIDVVDRCQDQQLRTEDEFRCHVWCQGQNSWQEVRNGANKNCLDYYEIAFIPKQDTMSEIPPDYHWLFNTFLSVILLKIYMWISDEVIPSAVQRLEKPWPKAEMGVFIRKQLPFDITNQDAGGKKNWNLYQNGCKDNRRSWQVPGSTAEVRRWV